MDLPPLPLLLYGEPWYYPCPRRVYLYLQEKKLPESVVKLVPDTDLEAGKDYPKRTEPTKPRLAIPKAKAESSKTDRESYIWIGQSVAIIEYLEDLCDAHPELSSVPSLRAGNDLPRRALVRGALGFLENMWGGVGGVITFGSKAFNDMTKQDSVHGPSVQVMKKVTEHSALEGLDVLLEGECDFGALEKDTEGAATIADVALYATLAFYRDIHGIDVAQGYPNIEKLVTSFEKRKSSTKGIPKGGYPEWTKPFREGWVGKPWASPDYEKIDARLA